MFTSQAAHIGDATRPPYNCVGLLSMKWTDGNDYEGTGALINSQYVLTCSHNLVDQQQETNAGYATKVTFFPGYNGTQNPVEGIKATHCFYSTRYFKGEDAWDVGIVKLDEPVTSIRHFYFNPHKINEDSELYTQMKQGFYKTVKVVGYPENMNGWMVEEEDEINFIDLKFNIVLHTSTTFPGSSGSPIYDYDTYQKKYLQYGIHVTREDLSHKNEIRRGVLITDAVYNWICTVLKYPTRPGSFWYPIE